MRSIACAANAGVSGVKDIEHIDEHRPCHAAYQGKGGLDSIGRVSRP
jgi:hypothetical protein